jgi:hypothetical protein
MTMNHPYDVDCPCFDCLQITFAGRFGSLQEHEIIGAGPTQIGDVSSDHEVTGNPQSRAPRSSGYGA